MRDGFHQFQHVHFDAQFLDQLAAQAFLERLERLTFAAREFPQVREVSARRTLREEQPTLSKHQTGGNVDGFHRGDIWKTPPDARTVEARDESSNPLGCIAITSGIESSFPPRFSRVFPKLSRVGFAGYAAAHRITDSELIELKR
jgi:hypothetical protein